MLTNAQPSNNSNHHQGERLPTNRYALFFLPLLVGAITDLVTKSLIFARCYDAQVAHQNRAQEIHYWIEGTFGIQTSTNPGALFGFGRGYSWLFAAFSVVALIGILAWLFYFKAAKDRWLTFALGLISGGIIGNFYDRVGWGYVASYPEHVRTSVRDWIYFYADFPGFNPWPNFNIADSVLVTGAIMLFVHAFFFAEPNPETVEG